MEIKKLKNSANSKILSHINLKSKAQKVYEIYVKEGSEKEVNLPASIRLLVWKNLQNALINEDKDVGTVNSANIVNAFKEANDDIMKLLGRDSYPRFCKYYNGIC